MGKSCSKHGNIEIDYDTVTSRAEPEGECLNSDDFYEFANNQCNNREKLTPETQIQDGATHLEDCYKYGVALDTLQFIKLEQKKEDVYNTQLVVDLPPSEPEDNDDENNSKPSEEKETIPVIKNSATQTSVSMMELPQTEDETIIAEEKEKEVEENQMKKEEVKDDVRSIRSTMSSQEEWSYTLYDFEGRGTVGDNDLSQLMQSICNVVGQSVNKGDYKIDKENRALKLKLAIGRESMEERAAKSKSKVNFSRMLFPPPESEEAARLSSYIEEKLSVHNRSSSRRCKSGKVVNRPTSGDHARPFARDSPRKGSCNCARDKRDRREKSIRGLSRNKRVGLDEEGSRPPHHDALLPPHRKEQKMQNFKRQVTSPTHEQEQACRCPKARHSPIGQHKHEGSSGTCYNGRIRGTGKEDEPFALPKRQETYPGASSVAECDTVLRHCRPSAEKQEKGRRTSNTGSGLPVDSYQYHCSNLSSVSDEDRSRLMDCSSVNFDNCSSVTDSADKMSSACATNGDCVDSSRYLYDGWPVHVETYDKKMDDLCAIERFHPNDSVRWRKSSSNPYNCSDKERTSGCYVQHRNSNEHLSPIDFNANAKHTHTRGDVDLPEGGHRVSSPGETVTSYVSLSRKSSSANSDRTSSTNNNLPGSQSESPWPQTFSSGKNTDVCRDGDVSATSRSDFSGLATSGSNYCNEPPLRTKKTKCPCHFRSSHSKLKASGQHDSNCCQHETREHFSPLSTNTTHCISNHTSQNHTHSYHQDVENIFNHNIPYAPQDGTKIQHVYRHEHHHYHYYIDNRV